MEALVRDAVQCMAQHHRDLRAWLADQLDAHEASTALQLRETSATRDDVRDLRSAQSQALDQLRNQQQQDLAQAIEAITAAADSIRRDLSTTTTDVTSAAQARSELEQQRANALSAKIHRLTILVILQWVALTAVMLVLMTR